MPDDKLGLSGSFKDVTEHFSFFSIRHLNSLSCAAGQAPTHPPPPPPPCFKVFIFVSFIADTESKIVSARIAMWSRAKHSMGYSDARCDKQMSYICHIISVFDRTGQKQKTIIKNSLLKAKLTFNSTFFPNPVC